MLKSSFAVALLSGLLATPANAGELLGGVYVHGVDTPFTFETGESGIDILIGVRSEPIEALTIIGKPQAHVFGSLNSERDGTDFVAAGLSWKIGKGAVYVRPGVGIALHNAPGLRVDPETGIRTDLGSRILFEPEIAIGVRASERVSIEASWVHISNARLFNSQQNPGIDMMGVRLAYRF